MVTDNIVSSFRGRVADSVHALLDVVPHLRRMIRKPILVGFWLVTARSGLLVLAFIAIAFPTVVPPAVETTLATVYEPVTEKMLFGLIQREKENPLLMPRRSQVIAVIWTLGICAVLVLLWLHIPRAITKAAEKSRAREREADTILTSDPSQSLLLYRSALAWATDDHHETRLVTKVGSLNDKLSTYLKNEGVLEEIDKSTLASWQQTLVMSASDNTASTDNRAMVGPDNRYRIDAQIGSGAMGIVYRGHDSVLDRDIAIKELHQHLVSDEELMSRFQQEARALARMTHPNIVQVYDFFRLDDRAYITMEFVDGIELEAYVENAESFTISNSVHIGGLLADALAYAHEQGVIHRDFKPANVLITPTGQPKITDFGLAKLSGTGFETLAGTIMGSPAYMSPEQALGRQSDERTDLYSFGVVLYWMTAGHLPFAGDARAMMDAHISDTPSPPAELSGEVPESLNDIVMKLLSKDPSTRIAPMARVASALRTVPL